MSFVHFFLQRGEGTFSHSGSMLLNRLREKASRITATQTGEFRAVNACFMLPGRKGAREEAALTELVHQTPNWIKDKSYRCWAGGSDQAAS